jgi:hypothetical protein
MPTTRNLAILVFGDVEGLDFYGPFEVFSVADRFTGPPGLPRLHRGQEARPSRDPWGPQRQPAPRLV